MGAHRFSGRDGVELAWNEIGAGRTLILLPGFGGVGSLMIEYGPARVLTQHGYRVVVPDSRGSGDSARPDDATGYPPDVLADDGFALVEHLGLRDGDFDLGGYSLGARIVVRMLARGAKPGRAIVAGQGLAKVSGPQGGGSSRRMVTSGAFARDGANPEALFHVLDSLVPTTEDALRAITVPTLVAIGDRDERTDADQLAALLPKARFVRVPGDHGSALAAPELAAAITEFLAGPTQPE
ncbi:alpha/beta fold hydrolase [Antrihabitans cavernicola]|uniref:Alpha/beta hydrolase n=1 Tax=Antrihabitans cavernicola TaxID=2495913 RepID=A0A5A7SF82_9NOCA|nr:alpha/beta fold hydrolase [Spelaeibacter cavernicola]KAA0024496.1 alpha/beta hydrolase [Spelaeibacter cavernicola]